MELLCISLEIMINEHIIYHKLEIATGLICQLYRHDIITEALIFGSVAKGTAKRYSDIDIYLINPKFQDEDNLNIDSILLQSIVKSQSFTEEQRNIVSEKWKSTFDLINILKDIGIEFKDISRKDLGTFTYQLYKGQLFHLLTRNRTNPFMIEESIKITRDLC